MKTSIFRKTFWVIVIAIIACSNSPQLLAQEDLHLVLQEEAFEKVCDMFIDQDVDIYSAVNKDGIESDEWIFFIDAVPLAYWEHQCYIIKYAKSHPLGATNTYELESLQYPPEQYNYTPLLVKDRVIEPEFPEIETVPTQPKYKGETEIKKEAAKHTYALLVGGGHLFSRYEDRYFWDCKKFYNALVKDNYVPKENINTIMYEYLAPTYPRDFDDDGIFEIKDGAEYRVTVKNVLNAIDSCYNKMQEKDNLIIFISAHGESKNIYLDFGEHLDYKSMQRYLAKFDNKNIPITLILGSCYSGKYAKRLKLNNCVIATAADSTESYHIDGPQGESFFLSGISDGFRKAHNKTVDKDNDGFVSIKEAFDYAYDRVMRTNELYNIYSEPQLISTPGALADVLAINRQPYFLTIANTQSITNAHSETINVTWNSPDIWIRQRNDGIEEPEHIDLKTTVAATIYVRVHNEGNTQYNSGKTLRLYWNQTTTNHSTDIWSTSMKFKDECIGGHIADIPLESINAHSKKIFSTRWQLPSEFIRNESHPESHQFGILATIVDNMSLSNSDSIMSSPDSYAYSSMSIIEKADTVRASTAFVYNPDDTLKSYNLYFKCRDQHSLNVFKYANIIFDLDPTIYYSWTRGGSCRDGGLAPGYVSPYSLELLQPESSLKNISMVGHGMGRVSVVFDFFGASYTAKPYTFDLIQTDSNKNIVGGHTIVLYPPHETFIPIPLDSIKWDDGGIGTINPTSLNDYDNAKWYNSKNQRVTDQPILTITPQLYNDTYKIVHISSEGELSTSEISVFPQFGIASLSPEGYIVSELKINLLPTEIDGYNITIASVLDGSVVFSRDLGANEQILTIDCSSYRAGIYVLICTLNGETLSTHKLIKR